MTLDIDAFVADLDALIRNAPGPFDRPTEGAFRALVEKHARPSEEVLALRAEVERLREDCEAHGSLERLAKSLGYANVASALARLEEQPTHWLAMKPPLADVPTAAQATVRACEGCVAFAAEVERLRAAQPAVCTVDAGEMSRDLAQRIPTWWNLARDARADLIRSLLAKHAKPVRVRLPPLPRSLNETAWDLGYDDALTDVREMLREQGVEVEP